MPGNPFGLRQLLYAGKPLRVAPVALCRETRPPLRAHLLLITYYLLLITYYLLLITYYLLLITCA